MTGFHDRRPAGTGAGCPPQGRRLGSTPPPSQNVQRVCWSPLNRVDARAENSFTFAHRQTQIQTWTSCIALLSRLSGLAVGHTIRPMSESRYVERQGYLSQLAHETELAFRETEGHLATEFGSETEWLRCVREDFPKFLPFLTQKCGLQFHGRLLEIGAGTCWFSAEPLEAAGGGGNRGDGFLSQTAAGTCAEGV